MIEATIQNGSRRTKIRFPCSEKVLSEKLGEIGVNPEHVSPVGTIIAIKKAIFRLGADSVKYCTFEIDSMLDLPDEWQEKFGEIERAKDIYGLNNLLKTEDIRLQEVQSSISNKEEMQIIGGLK